jgi:NADH dehydrogenase
VIFGKKDEFVNLFAGMIRTFPVVPAVGGGKSKLQPISVEDVAEGFVRALSLPETIGQTYNLGGPRAYILREILDIIAKVLNRKILQAPVPIWWMRFLATLFDQFPWFPVTREQLLMLQKDNVCDSVNFSKTFSIQLTPFEEGIRRYLISPK